MIKVPFLGTHFNTIMPLFIIIFGLVFAFLSVFKLKNRALDAFKKIGQPKEEKDVSTNTKEQDKKKAGEKPNKLAAE